MPSATELPLSPPPASGGTISELARVGDGMGGACPVEVPSANGKKLSPAAGPFAIRAHDPYSRVRGGFTDKRKRRFLAALIECGGSRAKAAKRASVSYSTVWAHEKNDPAFAEALKRCEGELAEGLVLSAYVRAQDPQGTQDRWNLIRSWLPQRYGERPTIGIQVVGEVTYADGTPV